MSDPWTEQVVSFEGHLREHLCDGFIRPSARSYCRGASVAVPVIHQAMSGKLSLASWSGIVHTYVGLTPVGSGPACRQFRRPVEEEGFSTPPGRSGARTGFCEWIAVPFKRRSPPDLTEPLRSHFRG